MAQYLGNICIYFMFLTRMYIGKVKCYVLYVHDIKLADCVV